MLITENETLTKNAAACDGPECNTWSREPEDHGFMELVWGPSRYVFCSGDCAMKFLAEKTTPVVVIPVERPYE